MNLILNTNQYRSLNHLGATIWQSYFNKFKEPEKITISSIFDSPEEKRRIEIIPFRRALPDAIEKRTAREAISARVGSSSIQVRQLEGLVSTYTTQNKKKEKYESKVFLKEEELKIETVEDYVEKRRGYFLSGGLISSDIAKGFENVQVRKETDKMMKILQRIEPSLTSLSLGTGGIIYADIGLPKLLPINCMGNGLHKLLSIVLSLFEMRDGFVLIDEIENGFHYSSLKSLWDSVFEASREFEVQVFATTHSIECVRAFNDASLRFVPKATNHALFRLEREDDTFNAVQYDIETLSASLDSEWEVR